MERYSSSSSSSSSSSWSSTVGPIKIPIISLQNVVPIKENYCHDHHTIVKPTLYSSSSDYDSPPSPATPLSRFYGVPFSWEKLPGIPKKLPTVSKALLPLPAPPPRKRFNLVDEMIRNMNCKKKTFEKDPFFAALVECSKDEDIMTIHNGSGSGSSGAAGKELTRSISDRFGIFINLYMTSSCKNGSSVSDSILHLPRSSSSSTRRTSHHYDLITHRP